MKQKGLARERTLFLILIPALWLFFSMAQQHNQQKVSSVQLQHEVSVTVKLIQVMVTDKDGKSVIDLTAEDFEIYDNSKKMAIAHFEKHSLFSPQDKTEAVVTSPALSTRSISRKFILLFDFAYQGFTGIRKARKAALHFIDTQLVPADEVAIITYSKNKGLSLPQYFTSDHQKIKELVELLTSSELVGGITSPGHKPIAGEDEEKLSLTFNLKKEHYINQARQFCMDVIELAKQLVHIPGTKNIILFSRGISNKIIYGQLPEGGDSGGEPANARLLDLLQKMGQWLAEAKCFVFAVNTEGALSNHFRNKFLAGDLSLRQLTQLSGGKYFDNVASYKGINKEISQMTSVYYVLGYYLDEKPDGRYHKVEVKVKKKGYVVHGQKGYFYSILFP